MAPFWAVGPRVFSKWAILNGVFLLLCHFGGGPKTLLHLEMTRRALVLIIMSNPEGLIEHDRAPFHRARPVLSGSYQFNY